MSAPARAWRADRPPALVDVLAARAAARAYLFAIGGMEMADAVDELESYAHSSGLVRDIGQDAVQAIIATAFEPYRREAALG
jgi:hypothetical protein